MSLVGQLRFLIENYGTRFLDGISSTLIVSLTSTLIGLLIGLIIGSIRTAPKSKNIFIIIIKKAIDMICSVYIEVFRGTPMMVQAIVFYYGYASVMNGETMGVLFSGILIVSINTGAYMAEIVRGGIISVDKGQIEGAKSIGMNHLQTMVYVVYPQALKNIMPSIANEFVVNIKDTSVLNVIYVTELFYSAKLIGAETAMYLPAYLIVAVIYFILTFTVTRILKLIEHLMNGNKNYTICGSQSSTTAQIKIGGDK